MVLKIAIVVSVLVALILILAAIKPKIIRIERSALIGAPPEKIFPLLDDFHNWTLWAPQDTEDSTMRRTYSGSERGVGAISEWNSSGEAGKGRMVITESVAPKTISIAVDFVKPFGAHNVNRFMLEPSGKSTKVTWAMEGTNLYIMRIMNLFGVLERTMGTHFETGLNNLRSIAER